MFVVIYDINTGDITNIGSPAPKGNIPPAMIPKERAAIKTDRHDLNASIHKVVNGEIVEREVEEVEEKQLKSCWDKLKAKRSQMLYATDWTQVPDSPVDKKAWADYRQALRDLPQNTTDPRNPPWPERPD